MPRKPTPDLLVDILDVSQETPTPQRPASTRLIDVFAAMDGTAPVAIYDAARTPDLVPIAHIDDNPYQPRLTYSGIEELAENIRLNGLLQPPAGRTVRGGRWQIAFGHRRLRAYRLLHETHGGDWGRIPMVVLPLTDDQMARHAWSENHNREDVSAVEEARLFARMMNDFGFTQQEIADDVGKSRSAVANTLRLLQLPDAAQGMIERGEITERHGRELLRLAGAQAWMDKFIEDLATQIKKEQLWTVAQLKRQISDYIVRNGTPLPDAPIEMNTWYGMKEVKPPPWPADFETRSPDAHGLCAGCAWLVKFDREPAGRCTDRKCYDTKDRIWTERERERQKAAAVAAATVAFTPTATEPELVEGESSQPDLPAAPLAEPVEAEVAPAGLRWSRLDRYRAHIFGSSDTPAALLEHGLCGAEQCECFALMMAHDSDLNKTFVGPDRVNAPNAVYVCENSSRLRAQRNRLEEIEAPQKAEERKTAIAEKSTETKAAKALLRELWQEIGVDGLSSSQASMATVVAALSGASYNHDKYDKLDLGELWDTLFWWLAGKRCQVNEWSNDGKRSDRWDLAKATQLRDQLRGELHRPASQPGPGDSQQTRWQDGWTVRDDEIYRMIEINPGTHLANLDNIHAPRVLLRLIEDMGDNKLLRSKLWKRYNGLVSQETPGP